MSLPLYVISDTKATPSVNNLTRIQNQKAILIRFQFLLGVKRFCISLIISLISLT